MPSGIKYRCLFHSGGTQSPFWRTTFLCRRGLPSSSPSLDHTWQILRLISARGYQVAAQPVRAVRVTPDCVVNVWRNPEMGWRTIQIWLRLYQHYIARCPGKNHVKHWNQIREIASCACTEDDGNVLPATDFKGNRWLVIPTCIMARASRPSRGACRDR